MWALPAVLIVPNVALAFTEYLYTTPQRLANVLLPLGIYMLLAGCWKKIGVTAMVAFPLMVLCAFQIVLLYLYGESIIAVDMYLNVVTTNAGEVGELLGNLMPAIAAVCILYIPPLVAGIVLTARHRAVDIAHRKPMLVAGGIVAALGIVAFAAAYTSRSMYHPEQRLFPVNVCANIVTAVERTEASNSYFITSNDFAFHSEPTAADSAEIIVLVIGETSRACNWELAGYPRHTNPQLSNRSGITFFSRALSESNTTHKSVPLLMSHLSSDCFGDSIYCVKGIADAFAEAGFSTAWISNQQRNGSLIDFFGSQADTVCFITDDGIAHHDIEAVRLLADNVDNAGGRLFAAVHTYGSHFNYRDRIPAGFGMYFPDDASEAERDNRPQLVNAYDNTIIYTDMVLDSIMDVLEATGRPAALMYLADHGEDIFDDSRNRFLHASPTPTYYQLHVPVLVWLSPEYIRRHPNLPQALAANSHLPVSSSRCAFHTLVQLAGLTMPLYDCTASLASESYTPQPPVFLNDYNEAVPLAGSGMRPQDFEQLRSIGYPLENTATALRAQ